MELPQSPEDKNDYIIRRKKRGKGSYKSGPYGVLKLPPPNRPPAGEGFEFKLPDGKKDEPPELFNKQTTFFALKRQKWCCVACGVLVKFSDASNWEADDIAQFKRDENGDVKGYCERCFGC